MQSNKIAVGNAIHAVDGTCVEDMTVEEVTALIRGDAGTRVSITLSSPVTRSPTTKTQPAGTVLQSRSDEKTSPVWRHPAQGLETLAPACAAHAPSYYQLHIMPTHII